MTVTEEYKISSDVLDEIKDGEFLKEKFARLLTNILRLRENVGDPEGVFVVSVSFEVREHL